MTCAYCEIIKSGQGVVFEDENSVMFMNPNSAMPGHLLVAPKEHFTIIEQMPDAAVKKLSTLANKASTALLQILGASGTNIIIENGTGAEQQVPHMAINVIPRVEGDGLNLQWRPRKLSDEQMSLAELQLKEQTKDMVVEQEKKAPVHVQEQPKQVLKEDNYLTRQLRRLP